MEKSLIDLTSFGRRLAELRKDKASNDDLDLNKKMVAEALGFSADHYRQLEAGKASLPTGSKLFEIGKYFGCNLNWLLYGEEPKYAARRGMEGEASNINVEEDKPQTAKIVEAELRDTIMSGLQGDRPPGAEQFRVSDALVMASRVLESGTSYAIALYLNIQHFDRAINAEARLVTVEQRIAELEDHQKDYEETKKQLAELTQSVKHLQDELARARAPDREETDAEATGT